MNTTSISALYSALGTLAYIIVVSLVMSNGERLFGEMDGALAQITFLSLFTLSAIVVGTLVLGKPAMLYLENKKDAAVSQFLQTTGWLAGFTAILMVGLAVNR